MGKTRMKGEAKRTTFLKDSLEGGGKQHIVALRKYTWSTPLSRKIGKAPRKWRSVETSKNGA
jgi:hypothetical protein